MTPPHPVTPPDPVTPTSALTPPSPLMPQRSGRAATAPALIPIVLVGAMTVATYSVVRYDLRIVATYTALTVALAAHLGLTSHTHYRPERARDRLGLSAALVAAGVGVWAVPGFTYLDAGPARQVRLLLACTAIAAALTAAVPWRRSGDLTLGVAVLGYLGSAALLLRLDPAPSIDVWYILQGAADGLAQGRNMYTQVWVAPPGVMAGFTYLPWTVVLLAPGRWLFGDVRVALIVATLAAAVALRALGSRPRSADGTGSGTTPDTGSTSDPASAGRSFGGSAAALLLLLPGTATQVEQAWTEPLLLACLALAALAMTRGRWGWAVVLLALALASKQHIALVLPLLAAWPRFGLRRTLGTAALAGLLVSPWLLADLAAMLDDTVALLIRYQPLRFADSLYVAAINEWGWRPPFWATGAVVAVTLLAAAVLVRRRDPEPGVFMRWCALVLLVASLVNKQAFYNQYWLVAALVLLSLTPQPTAPGTATTRAETARESVPAPS